MKYSVEQRGLFFVAVDREAGVELAPWFECEQTALEIGRRTVAEEPTSQYMGGIPLVPMDTPIPRPANVDALHPKAIAKMIEAGKPASEAWKRHRLNPRG